MTIRWMKPRPYGTPKEIISRAYEQIGEIDRVTATLGIGRARAYALADPQEAREQLSYTEARQLTTAGATAFAEDMAFLAGGAFVPMPASDPADLDQLETLTADSAEKMGEEVAASIRACQAGSIDPKDAQGWLLKTDSLIRDLIRIRTEVNRHIDPVRPRVAAE